MSGMNLARRVGLELGQCKKFSEAVECSPHELEKILRENFTGDGIFVAWQIQDIVWGKFDGEKLLLKNDASPNFDDWLECRVFNRREELHLKRADEKFFGRYVRDEDGTENFFVDSFSRLWGERLTDGWITLQDAARKISMELPIDGGEKFFGLLTRNYIGSDEATGLSGYVDYRFVAIESAWDGD